MAAPRCAMGPDIVYQAIGCEHLRNSKIEMVGRIDEAANLVSIGIDQKLSAISFFFRLASSFCFLFSKLLAVTSTSR